MGGSELFFAIKPDRVYLVDFNFHLALLVTVHGLKDVVTAINARLFGNPN